MHLSRAEEQRLSPHRLNEAGASEESPQYRSLRVHLIANDEALWPPEVTATVVATRCTGLHSLRLSGISVVQAGLLR
eukprot:scaffold234_cov406-Prasinococcus_capsulatus_cf.AAC.9